MNDVELIKEAFEARKQSYCPYSEYAVGAALLTKEGKVYHGCNIENAAFGPSICAERTAIFKTVSEGEHDFEMIAIVGGNINGEVNDFAYPCGVCRQVMREFCDEDSFQIIVAIDEDTYLKKSLRELLPFGFGPENL